LADESAYAEALADESAYAEALADESAYAEALADESAYAEALADKSAYVKTSADKVFRLAAEALVNDFFFEARVSTEFFDGNELMFLLIKMHFYFSQEGTTIAITFACEALDILGVDSQPFHCHGATISFL
jgi:hypothetical protein